MSKLGRIEKLKLEREGLESDYRSALIDALQDCLAGRYGLFKQNSERLPPVLEKRMTPQSVKELERIGEELDRLNATLGLGDFGLQKRLSEYRNLAGANAPGEPKLAHQFLEELLETE